MKSQSGWNALLLFIVKIIQWKGDLTWQCSYSECYLKTTEYKKIAPYSKTTFTFLLASRNFINLRLVSELPVFHQSSQIMSKYFYIHSIQEICIVCYWVPWTLVSLGKLRLTHTNTDPVAFRTFWLAEKKNIKLELVLWARENIGND